VIDAQDVNKTAKVLYLSSGIGFVLAVVTREIIVLLLNS
jgi:hypothetical protein